MIAATHRWFAEYAAHLRSGAATLRGGEPLTQAFADRCQELDDGLRRLDRADLREASQQGAGPELLAALHAAQQEFEGLASPARERIKAQIDGLGRGRVGIRGYATAGQRLKTTGGFYLDRQI